MFLVTTLFIPCSSLVAMLFRPVDWSHPGASLPAAILLAAGTCLISFLSPTSDIPKWIMFQVAFALGAGMNMWIHKISGIPGIQSLISKDAYQGFKRAENAETVARYIAFWNEHAISMATAIAHAIFLSVLNREVDLVAHEDLAKIIGGGANTWTQAAYLPHKALLVNSFAKAFAATFRSAMIFSTTAVLLGFFLWLVHSYRLVWRRKFLELLKCRDMDASSSRASRPPPLPQFKSNSRYPLSIFPQWRRMGRNYRDPIGEVWNV
jgi:hypothetical protein